MSATEYMQKVCKDTGRRFTEPTATLLSNR